MTKTMFDDQKVAQEEAAQEAPNGAAEGQPQQATTAAEGVPEEAEKPKGQIEKVKVTRQEITASHGALEFKTLADIYRFGQYVIQSGMFPQFHEPSQIVIVSQIAKDTNIPLSQALQNIAFINNRATLWGDALLSAAYGSGKIEDFREDLSGEGDGMVATCSVKRRGMPSPIIRKFSAADAIRADLWGSKKDNWRKYPQRMLQMRARSWALRDAGLTQGIIAREEAEDYEPQSLPEVPDTGGEKRKFGLKGSAGKPDDKPDPKTKAVAKKQVDALEESAKVNEKAAGKGKSDDKPGSAPKDANFPDPF